MRTGLGPYFLEMVGLEETLAACPGYSPNVGLSRMGSGGLLQDQEQVLRHAYFRLSA